MKSILSPRIAELHRSMVETIPCDDRASWREALRALPFPRTMCVYLNWVARMIPPRPRKVRFADGFWSSEASIRRHDAVEKLVRRIEAGEDLAPHYSGRVEHKGFALDRCDTDGQLLNHKWRDKDFALNALGVHHLHLGDGANNGRRSDDLLFVAVGKDEAVCILVGGHRHLEEDGWSELETRVLEASFGLPDGRDNVEISEWTPSERWQLTRAGFSTPATINGQVVISASVTNAGMRDATMFHASRILRAIAHVDQLIDEPSWVVSKFDEYGIAEPASPDFEWMLNFGSLLLHERSSRTAFCIVEDRLGLPKLPGAVLLKPKAAYASGHQPLCPSEI